MMSIYGISSSSVLYSSAIKNYNIQSFIKSDSTVLIAVHLTIELLEYNDHVSVIIIGYIPDSVSTLSSASYVFPPTRIVVAMYSGWSILLSLQSFCRICVGNSGSRHMLYPNLIEIHTR